MPEPVITIDITSLERLVPALQEVGVAVRALALPRAMNRVGHTAAIAVKRRISKQMGALRSRVGDAVHEKTASGNNLVFKIVGRDAATSLADFAHKQTVKGVRATAWGKSKLYRSTFIGPNGQIFKRAGPAVVMTKGKYAGHKRQPIKKLFGPIIPRELVAKESVDIVNTTFNEKYTDRLAHEVAFETGRIMKSHNLRVKQ